MSSSSRVQDVLELDLTNNDGSSSDSAGGAGVEAAQADVTVNGWVRSLRKHKKYSFVEIGDGSGWDSLQAVLPTGSLPPNVSTGASVTVRGSPSSGRGGTVELQATELTVVGACDPETYPLQKKYHSPDFLREKLCVLFCWPCADSCTVADCV